MVVLPNFDRLMETPYEQGVTSIIVGAAIGALFFKERFGAPRVAAAGLLVVGIGLMLRAG